MKICLPSKIHVPLFLITILLLTHSCTTNKEKPLISEKTKHQKMVKNFFYKIKQLQTKLKIPGLSVAIIKNRKIIAARGLGLINSSKDFPAKATTPYKIGSLTKTITTAILLKLVSQKKLSLTHKIKFEATTNSKQKTTTLYNVLTHTIENKNRFRYRPDLFSVLNPILKKIDNRNFESQIDALGFFKFIRKNNTQSQVHATGHDQEGHPQSALHHDTLNVRYGLSASVLELAQFDIALENNRIIPAKWKRFMLTQKSNSFGEPLPVTGGFFTSQYKNRRIVWNYGLRNIGYSALYIKIPAEKTTLILLANSKNATAPFLPGYGSLLGNPFALAFFAAFNISHNKKSPTSNKSATALLHNYKPKLYNSLFLNRKLYDEEELRHKLAAEALYLRHTGKTNLHEQILLALLQMYPPDKYYYHTGFLYYCALAKNSKLRKIGIKIAQKLRSEKTANPYLIFHLACIYLRSGETSLEKKAPKLLLEAIMLDRSHNNYISIWSHYHMALYLSHHDPQTAASHLRAAIKLSQNNPATHKRMRLALYSIIPAAIKAE